ncbi:MAG TPA: Hsp20/alpha crystallin family protein [Tissierellia bacterium]|jgi:HSP20 family protein|nr:Hsp20/alpha crystallin family protein [Tissierellia bacterium]
MAGLIPFNRRHGLYRDLGNFYNMVDDFFSNNWPYEKFFSYGTFKMDVRDNENEYIVEAELPGVEKEEISLEFNDGRMTISVNRKEEIKEEKNNYIHRERRQSSMNRSVYLNDAKDEGIKASLENGLLRIVVPKKEDRKKSRRIEIN